VGRMGSEAVMPGTLPITVRRHPGGWKLTGAESDGARPGSASV
jgi:hypothetical protein